jgi:hypothetical protein
LKGEEMNRVTKVAITSLIVLMMGIVGINLYAQSSATAELAAPNFRLPGTGSNAVLGPALASAATIAPTHAVHHVTGTTNVVNITPPWTGFTGQIVLIPDAIFATTAAGNIALASTAVVSKALIMTYDPVAAKWYPSY